jgi:CheY-like chemotaxis protein
LIVDESAESRDILRTLLERRGATTIEARHPEQAIPLADFYQPNLIVLDAESDHSSTGNATSHLQAAARRNDTPIVILGTIRPRDGHFPAGQFVAKPYHYGQLICKIEGLLEAA